MDSSGSEQGIMILSPEYGPIKYWEVFGQEIDYKLLKNNSPDRVR